MNSSVLKTVNLFLEIAIWVGVWGLMNEYIETNISPGTDRHNFYIAIVIVSLLGIYAINGRVSFMYTATGN
tara:strand:- start:67 stop:279 length:213 start_codon:yes stop_codon:yes gene_type:complete